MTMQLILEFREVFDEEPKELKDYLEGISRATMLQIGTHFLSTYSTLSQSNDSRTFLSNFFSQQNQEVANEIYKKVLPLEKESGSVHITWIHSSLRLFEYCFEHLDEHQTQTEAEAEVNIFKAYLLLNQQYTQNEDLIDRLSRGPTNIIEWAEEFLTHSFVYSELINFSRSVLVSTQIIKTIYLFEFFERNDQYHALLREFVRAFDCTDWKEYLKKLLPLIVSILNKDRPGYLTLTIPDDNNYTRNCTFLEQLTLGQNNSVLDIDFRQLRANPLYKVKEGSYQIIFDKFVFEKIFKGLYFYLNQLNSTLQTDKIPDFRSFWGDEYSEKLLLYNVLQETYENRYIKFSGEKIRGTGITAEPDYYIRNGNKIFLFESKDILIKADVKTSFDYHKIESELKKKLYFVQQNGKVKNKAVLQLINNIERILTKSFPFDERYKENSIRIYPILVLHDHQFNLAGLNVIVNSWFQDELKKLEKDGLNIKNVSPLTIIDIDTLIFYQDQFKVRRITLNTLIEGYHKHITYNSKRSYSDLEEKKRHVLKTLNPFSTFLSHYCSVNKIPEHPPKILSEKGFSIFK